MLWMGHVANTSASLQLLLSLEKEWLQEPRVVGACVVWPLDEEEAPPLALEVAPVEGATRKRRDGSICAQFCLAQRTDVLPLDQLTYSRAVWHTHLDFPSCCTARPSSSAHGGYTKHGVHKTN